jgi:hypothetical protein
LDKVRAVGWEGHKNNVMFHCHLNWLTTFMTVVVVNQQDMFASKAPLVQAICKLIQQHTKKFVIHRRFSLFH